MSKFNVTNIVLILFIAYVCNCIYVVYVLFNPPNCRGNESKCLRNLYKEEDFDSLTISVFTSPKQQATRHDLSLLWENRSVSVLDHHSSVVNVTLPEETRKNGSLYAHIFVHLAGKSPFDRRHGIAYANHALTQYAVPKDEYYNLMTSKKKEIDKKTITHMHPRLIVHVVSHSVSFHQSSIPSDIYHLIRIGEDGTYLPLLYVDGMSEMIKNMKPINASILKLPLKIEYSPISIGRLRMWSSVEQTLDNMKALGFTNKDLDDLKGIFTDTNLYFLAMTFSIAILHMLFDFLAFKNDINFWRKKQSMEGLSFRTVLWRCISTAIIFLYLLDEETSLLVLIPAGIGSLIEVWKVLKALKVSISFQGSMIPRVEFGEKSKSEAETDKYDSEAMQYLSYALYPLLVCGAVYSLLYQPHKSWYSWIITSAVNGVYAFGFLFMLPQLFVNYKLKSVAHLPWRAFMYKAFNTFIDDVFAFIITMPTAHRLACFRDDLVFLVYLYQRWLYPVDKSRVNEFGMSFEEETKRGGSKTSKKEQ